MSDRRKVLPQYVLPKRGLTVFAGRVASRERGPTTTRLVRWFVRKYGVDMSEAAAPNIDSYASFNDFFTRALKEGARPLADATLTCPVSSGWRSESSTARWNSGSSSRNSTPRCARLISPGRTFKPPPTNAGIDAE